MTVAEIRLWKRLRSRQLTSCKFRRQHPYLDYILDFVCLETRLLIEVDGGQHQESERDQGRDRRLQEAGFQVLRFWSNQVLQETDAPHFPHPNPPPRCGRGGKREGHKTMMRWSRLSGRLYTVQWLHPIPTPTLEGEGVAHGLAHAPR